VPYTRGGEVSRPFDDVLTEVAGLAANGVGEVTLLGQNVNAYRGDMEGTNRREGRPRLLIEYIAEVPGIERIRYTTSHPREMSQRLIDTYATVPKLVSHLHLPVQAGSDRVLAAMKRGYTALEYKSIIRKLRAARPDISLSTDFIVGFPGETDEDFEKTMKLIDDVGFDNSFSFIYSPRPGTPALELEDSTRRPGQIGPPEPPAEAHRRAGAGHQPGHGRQRQRVLVEGTSKKDVQRTGRAHRQQPHRQLSRQPAPDQHLRRCPHHVRPAAQPEGRNCHPRRLRRHPKQAGRTRPDAGRQRFAGQSVRAAGRKHPADRNRLRCHSPPQRALFDFRRKARLTADAIRHFYGMARAAAVGR
jgi:MiaB/RimO family radical SAM methylthiotransferase